MPATTTQPIRLSRAARARARQLHERPIPHPTDDPARQQRGMRAVDRWRRETALLDDQQFATRLAEVGLSTDDFMALLSADPAAAEPRVDEPRFDERLDWYQRLEAAYAESSASDQANVDVMPLGALADAPDAALIAPARRLLDHSWRGLLNTLESRGDLQLLGEPRSLATQLAHAVPLDVHRMIHRAVIMELQIARFEERLTGDTPEARFDSFIAEVESPAGAMRFFDQYPVLARDLVTRSDQWLATSQRFVDRLARDRDAMIERFFDGRDPGLATGLETELSDRHQNGETVAIVTFARGDKVVYKPRPLAIDHAFADLLDWLHDRAEGRVPRLRVPKVLDRGPYGWAEYIDPAPCKDRDGVARYYQRQGAYIALLFAIEGTDFHHENVIAHGEHPMLIDLETIFQPVVGSVRLADGDSRPLAFSVLRSGLLPVRFSTDPNARGFDVSGLGGLGNPLIGAREARHVGTDLMHYESTQVPMPQYRNRPTVRTDEGLEDALAWHHTAAIIAGFDAMMEVLIEQRDALLGDDSPLDSFHGLELRHIARPTNLYIRLLEAMRHPDFQQDGLVRERLLDKLWLDAQPFAHFRPLVVHERASLARFDVPRFHCHANGRDLVSDSGRRLEGYFDASPLDRVRRRLAQLGPHETERQRWMVRASIEAIKPTNMGFRWQSRPQAASPTPWAAARAEATARRVGRDLAILRQRLGRDAESWFQLGIAPDDRWHLEPVRCDLYNGLAGIALFFAHLAAYDPGESDPDFRQLARTAMETARLSQAAPDFAWPSIGAGNGLGGWLYTRAHLARLWHDPALLAPARAEVEMVADMISDDRGLDIIAGAAGAIAGLLALHAVAPDPHTMAVATACGDHLLDQAEPRDEGGLAWPAVNGSNQPLTGFAHGTAGFAWALARLAGATGETRFAHAAREAMAYERAFFDPEVGAWPDLREQRAENGKRPFFYAWCHGAPGIGLARLDTRTLLDDHEAMTAEVRAAVDATFDQGFGMNHGLCHGDLGNLELVVRAAQQLDEPAWQARAHDLAARVVHDMETHGWRGGIGDSGVLQPGLFTGLAGMGYGLLRLAHPERVPSILTFDLPPAR